MRHCPVSHEFRHEGHQQVIHIRQDASPLHAYAVHRNAGTRKDLRSQVGNGKMSNRIQSAHSMSVFYQRPAGASI